MRKEAWRRRFALVITGFPPHAQRGQGQISPVAARRSGNISPSSDCGHATPSAQWKTTQHRSVVAAAYPSEGSGGGDRAASGQAASGTAGEQAMSGAGTGAGSTAGKALPW